MENTEALIHTEADERQLQEELRIPPPLPCPKCGREFKNEVALRMHDLRKHSDRNWDTGKNFRGGKKKRLSVLEKKRKYNRDMRERFYAEGRNSRGEQMPPGWKPRPRYGGNTGMKLAGWSPERRAKFNATKRKAKKIQIVFPDPRQKALEEEAIRNTWPIQDEAAVQIPQLKYCPNCGEHIEGWRFQS